MRDYVHVCDLARAHVLALEHLLDGDDRIAVNLGTGRGASVRQLVDAVRRITGREVIARDASRRAGDPPALVADPKKAGECEAGRRSTPSGSYAKWPRIAGL